MKTVPVFTISIPRYHEFLGQNNIDNTPKVYQVYSLVKTQAEKEKWLLKEELSQARKLIAELVKMGEFYGNPESWVRGKNDGNMGINSTDREYLNPCNYGGKRAREVLSNNKDLIEKLTKE